LNPEIKRVEGEGRRCNLVPREGGCEDEA